MPGLTHETVKSLKPLLIALVTVVAVAVAFYWFSGERGDPVARDVPSQSGDTSVAVPEESARGPGPASQPKPRAREPLWRAADPTSVNEAPAYGRGWSTEGRVLVRVTGTAAAASNWRVGDRLTIPVPQLGETYDPRVDEIDDGPFHSRAALGKIVGNDGRPRRFVVTVGPMGMFAFIDTPEGSYELVAGPDLGWLVPTASMMAGWDFSRPDYIRPGDERPGRGVPARGPDDAAL